jgi:hypothetical protein
MNDWLASHLWVTFLLIFFLMSFVYVKVFRTRKLPLLKSLIVYVLIAIGSIVLLIFQVDVGLPIVASLSVAVLLMAMVKVRYMLQNLRSPRKPRGERVKEES